MKLHRRATNVILSISALIATGAVGPIGDADAYEGVGVSHCTGTGSAQVGSGLAYFPNVTIRVPFTFTFNCLTGGSYTGTGVLDSASCGRSSGRGTFYGSSKGFVVETSGSMLIAVSNDGDVRIAVGNATPIPDMSTIPFGNTCMGGTAKNFTLIGGMMCVDTHDGAICNSLRH